MGKSMPSRASLVCVLLWMCFGVPAHPAEAGEVHIAAKAGDLTTVKRLVEADFRCTQTWDENGKTPLHLAAGNGRLEVVRFLLDAGVSCEIQNPFGGPPLHVAASQNHPDVARLLIARGAKVDARRRQGNATPLHICAMKGREEIAHLLVEAGADVHARMQNGATAAMVARFRGHTALAEWLRTVSSR